MINKVRPRNRCKYSVRLPSLVLTFCACPTSRTKLWCRAKGVVTAHRCEHFVKWELPIEED